MTKSLVGLSALLVALSGALIAQNKLLTIKKVVDVIDGDTIVVDTQRLRLRGVSAPELENCYGEESKEYLTKLIKNKKVIITDPIADKWGRVVALVYLNNKLINLELIKNGFAHYESGPTSMKDQFQSASDYARTKKLGIFSSVCSQTANSKNPNCNIKGNIIADRDTKIFHLPYCQGYNLVTVDLSIGEQWFCTESDAITAGYTKSQNCP